MGHLPFMLIAGGKETPPRNGPPAFCRDPYIIHLNLALQMVVSLHFGVEKTTCFKWLQNGDLLRSPVEAVAWWGLVLGGETLRRQNHPRLRPQLRVSNGCFGTAESRRLRDISLAAPRAAGKNKYEYIYIYICKNTYIYIYVYK